VTDPTRPVREGEELDLAAVEGFLRSAIPGLEGPLEVAQFPSGASNLTYLVKAGDREMVLRRPPRGRKARSAHDMSVLGCDFYLMERLDGIILRKNLPREMRLSREETTQLCRNVVDRLIDLHSIDYRAAGLGDLGKPEGYVRRQIEGWSRRFVDAPTPNAPSYERVMRWLEEKMPPEFGACVIHGDYRFDNVVLNPDNPLEVIGVLDWEMATIGDPLMDLGNSLAYWMQKGDPLLLRMTRLQPTHLEGMMTREEVVDYYCRKTGIEIETFDFYRIYGVFRLVVIMQQIYYRYYHRQTRNKRFGRFIYLIRYLEGYLERLIDGSLL